MTSEKRPQTRLTGTASQFAVYAEMTAARSRGGFSFDPNTCGYIENDPRATRSAGTTPSPAGSKGGVDPTGNLLLSGQKGQEEERSYQRKTRHEKGHNRPMFLHQRIQHLYRSHDAPLGVSLPLQRGMHLSRGSQSNAVAPRQQLRFVWCSTQLPQGARVSRKC
jgi:hypothetical protein